MSTVLELKQGEEVFSLLDLFQKAASIWELEIGQTREHTYSKPIKTYRLDEGRLAALEKHGIRRQPRPDVHVFTLVDENSQEEIPGWTPSNYWNFKPKTEGGTDYDLEVRLAVEFRLSERKRGIILHPCTFATLVSPGDRLPNFRMFVALVETDPAAPSIADEIAELENEGDGLVVTWTQMGLGGIRSIGELFHEFSRGNKEIEALGARDEVFLPLPFPLIKPLERAFVVEEAQPKLMDAWAELLKKYRQSLELV